MRALVIGGDGFIGSALVSALSWRGHEVVATSRRGNGIAYDLLEPGPLPPADVVYLAAAAIEPPDWRVNVDGTLAVAMDAMRHDAFPVFISSRAVEVRDDPYARMKAHVEAALWGLAGIVRIGVFKDGLPFVLKTLAEVGEQRKIGLTVVGGLA